MNDRLVELLVDGSEESTEAKRIAKEFDPRIMVKIYNTRGDYVPLAFWCNAPYQGIEEIKLLKTTLKRNLDQNRI